MEGCGGAMGLVGGVHRPLLVGVFFGLYVASWFGVVRWFTIVTISKWELPGGVSIDCACRMHWNKFVRNDEVSEWEGRVEWVSCDVFWNESAGIELLDVE